MALSYQAIYPRVKAVIASIKPNLDPRKVRASSEFSKPPLSFTSNGKVALRGHFNAEFSAEFSAVGKRITAPQMKKVKTVRDVAKLIHTKLGG